MRTQASATIRILALTCLCATLGACGKKAEPPPADSGAPAAAPAAPAPAGAAATSDAAAPAADYTGSWTPEALEELLAPIAIYPDVVLGHVLTASTNPQEVLDAGNWLIENQDLRGAELDEAAQKLGLSPSVRALLQFPETVDMMCMKMDWTTQLGQAFTADQGAVLDAVQRLRRQATDVGNLKSSEQLTVETEKQQDKEVVTVKPADPEVVYVPKYDPVAVYAPPPASIPPPTTVAVAGTTTTTAAAPAPAAATTTEDKGHSTGALVTTGLLAFGAGILVNEIFDDDDDWDDYYPNYGYGGMYYGSRPYYPPPPYMYRPPYGPGFYPSHGYTRPPNYQHGFNNNTIIINNGGNDYWNNFNPGSPRVGAKPVKSPITAARPNRPELANLNSEAAARKRPATQQTPGLAADDRKGQTGYAGARPENREARDRMVQQSPKATDLKTGAAEATREAPKRPQGTYAGANKRPETATGKRPETAAEQRPPATRDAPKPRPAAANADRGRDPTPMRPTVDARPDQARPAAAPARPQLDQSRPSPGTRPASAPTRDRSAFDSGGRSASQERAASQRGRASKPAGAHGGQRPRR
jgi:hypothetical protein